MHRVRGVLAGRARRSPDDHADITPMDGPVPLLPGITTNVHHAVADLEWWGKSIVRLAHLSGMLVLVLQSR
jgi:hypothetical protein